MRTEIDQYIINVIRKKRLDVRMSQEDLAEKLGFKSNGFVGQIESANSTKKYNAVHINKAAIIFSCSPKDFLPEQALQENKTIRPLKKKGSSKKQASNKK